MLRFTRKALYALEAVLDIAYHGRPDPVQSKEVAERQEIPQRYLEQVMQHLVRAGILRGVRGPRGGYRLARERRRISAGEIMRLVAQMEAEEASIEEGLPKLASALGAQVVSPILERIQQEILTRLDQITLEDLCRDADNLGLAGKTRPKMDFTI
jgi:Rrf2 family protein